MLILSNSQYFTPIRAIFGQFQLTALRATHRELWARCPLLGTGEAILSSPQLKRAVILNIRPACSRRKFVT